MSLYNETTVLNAVLELLNNTIDGNGKPVPAGLHDATWGDFGITIELVTPPRQSFLTLGGPTHADIEIQTTTLAPASLCRPLGAKVRERLTELKTDGDRKYPININLYGDITSQQGFRQKNGNIYTWVERYIIPFQA